jgi:predicted nucleotide-binding protein
VNQSNFINRLKYQTLGIFNKNITERLKSAYQNDPIEFIGLFSTLIPIILLFITIGLLIFVVLLIPTISHLFTPYIFGALFLFMIFFFFGSVILGIKHRNDDLESTQEKSIEFSIEKKKDNKSIFIVHGHDSKIKDEVTEFLRILGLTPIVLQDEPNLGKTIIEKVEHYVSQTSFAIVILTKDDFGVSKKDFDIDMIREQIEEINSNGLLSQLRLTRDYIIEESLDTPPFGIVADLSDEMLKHIKSRARQNVIFELGITIGHLGRNKVRVLYEDGVELPTDIQGFAYTVLDNKWKENIVKELKAVHIDCKKVE